jgi:glutamate 5-kinase
MPSASAAGQSRLIGTYNRSLARHDLVAAQVLLVPNDFVDRRQYLHARQTLLRLIELGCIPIINENDALASHELRYGDNDRIAALVAHNVNADLLVLLTDTPGLFTADPRSDASAELIREVLADEPLLTVRRAPQGPVAAVVEWHRSSPPKMASWSGTRGHCCR